MSKVLFTVAVPHTGESRRPSFVISTNNLNAVQISKKGIKLGNTNYNGGFKRFEYSVGGNQTVTKFSLVVNTSALLPHITWATGLPLPVIGNKKKKGKRSSSADASSRQPQRPQLGRRASSMDRIEISYRRQKRIEDGRKRREITDGWERRPSRRYDDEVRKVMRSSRHSDLKNARHDDRSREDRRSSNFYSDDDGDDKYSRLPSRHEGDRKSRYSSDDRSDEYKPRMSLSTRYDDPRRYDRYKDRLAPLSEVDAYEKKYGKEARKRRYKRQQKYDGGEIVDDGPNAVDANDDGGLEEDGDVEDFGADGDAGDAGADGGE